MDHIKPRYEKTFGPANRIIRIGSLHVPSGKLVACDPFFAGIAVPFSRQVTPGQYEAEIAVKDLVEWGPRNAMARLVIDPNGRARTFESANLELADSNRYPVESGLGCFMDEVTRQHFTERLAKFYQANSSGNYYDDVLAKAFKENADPADPFDEGSWNMHVLPDSPFNVAMFASGLGDGSYESFWVLGERDAVIALVTDFNLE